MGIHPHLRRPLARMGDRRPTGFYLWSTLAIPGVFFALMIDDYFYHYFYVFCPFLFVMLAACMLPCAGSSWAWWSPRPLIELPAS